MQRKVRRNASHLLKLRGSSRLESNASGTRKSNTRLLVHLTTKGKGDKLEVRSINDASKALAEKTFGAEKAKEFKTKALRSYYNSALLPSGIEQEVKDLLMGHARMGARGHYDYDEYTTKEAYAKAFEHLSINGVQTRGDIAKLEQKVKNLTMMD